MRSTVSVVKMGDVPETQYARVADDSYAAYQVIGDSPIDIVYTAGWFGHVEAQWEPRRSFLQALRRRWRGVRTTRGECHQRFGKG